MRQEERQPNFYCERGRPRHPHFETGQGGVRKTAVIDCESFLANLGSRSKNLFLNFGTLSGVPKNRSGPNPHVRRDRLPTESLSAKCGNPLRIEDPLGTAQSLALCAGISDTGPGSLGDLALACDRIKQPRISWHSFRHTHATLLHANGETLKTAQALLGHSDLETTLNVYTHTVTDSQRIAVERVAGVLFSDVLSSAPAAAPGGRPN